MKLIMLCLLSGSYFSCQFCPVSIVGEMKAYPFTQLLQDVDFYQGLLVEALFVSNDLNGDQQTSLVVNASNDLAETAFSKHVHNFVTICKMISHDNVVITTIVVIS